MTDKQSTIRITMASGESGQRIIWEKPPVPYSDMTLDELDRFIDWMNEVSVTMRTRRRNARPVSVEFCVQFENTEIVTKK